MWLLVTHPPLNRRAPPLALAMDKMSLELSLLLGVEALNCDTGVEKITEVLQTNLAPEASDAGFRDVLACVGLRRPRLTLDEYLSRFEMTRRRAEARLPNNGIFPDIMLSSLRLRHVRLTPNQNSAILSSTGGDPSLETTKRQMRRISQPCGGELKQNVLVVKDDLLNTQESPSWLLANETSGDETFIGDAQVAPKKKKGRGLLLLCRGLGICPTKLILARVDVTSAMVVGANSICFRSASVNNRMLPAECPLRWEPPIKTTRTP